MSRPLGVCSAGLFVCLAVGCGAKLALPSEPASPPGPTPPPPKAADDQERGAAAFPNAAVGRWAFDSGDKSVSELFAADTEFTADGRALQKDKGANGGPWVERYKYQFEGDMLILSDKTGSGRLVASLKVADITADKLVLTWPKAALKRLK